MSGSPSTAPHVESIPDGVPTAAAGNAATGPLVAMSPAPEHFSPRRPHDAAESSKALDAGRSETAMSTENVVLRRPLALSPSRAQDFKRCPLLYRFRTIDRLPEPPSSAAVRGTLVHAVLEEMFDRPATARTPDITAAEVVPVWERLRAENPEWESLFTDAAGVATWLDSAVALVHTYFRLEDPRRFEPEASELLLELRIGDDVPLRGVVDRMDIAPTGQIRVVDYKTGSSPKEAFLSTAIYQMKFYALMVWRLRGVVPTQLKLLYLGNATPIIYTPDEAELEAFERSLSALWSAILAAVRSGNFQPRRSRLCDWCAYRDLCPEFDGTPPAYPESVARQLVS